MEAFPDFMGCTVRDVISGYSGVVTQMLRLMSGNYQAAIQPKSPEDSSSLPDVLTIDTHTLEKVDDKFVHMVTTPVFTIDVILGNKVEDISSGFTGIATKELIHINGCVFYFVVPKMQEKTLIQTGPDGAWVNQTLLKVVGDGIVDQTTKVNNPAEATKAPGGFGSKLPARKPMAR